MKKFGLNKAIELRVPLRGMQADGSNLSAIEDGQYDRC